MSGHSRWWMERPEDASTAPQVGMIPHVQGYILAMEDVLRDLERFRAECDSDADIIDSLEHSADESLKSTRRTLETLTKKVEAE